VHVYNNIINTTNKNKKRKACIVGAKKKLDYSRTKRRLIRADDIIEEEQLALHVRCVHFKFNFFFFKDHFLIYIIVTDVKVKLNIIGPIII
jgi:hypothetical protein